MSATWLDGVKRQDFGTNGGSWTRQPALIVLHSTETGRHGWPGYSDGSSCPHFTIDPETGEARQHVSLAYAARALKHPSGTPETNRAGAVQIEIIGTCDPSRKGSSSWLYLPNASSAQLANIRALLDKINAATGIGLATSVDFEPYPSPGYGSGPPRLSSSAWSSYKGVLGHQHVPSNDHGDPGNLDVAALLGGSSSGGSDDMPNYVHVGITSTRKWDEGWHYWNWDVIWSGDDVANVGSPSIFIPSSSYVATLHAQLTVPETGSTIRSRTIEGDTDSKDKFVVQETNPTKEHPWTTGDTFVQDSRAGYCNKGRRLRFSLYVPVDGCVLQAADGTVLWW
jgi:hypothetical protein